MCREENLAPRWRFYERCFHVDESYTTKQLVKCVRSLQDRNLRILDICGTILFTA